MRAARSDWLFASNRRVRRDARRFAADLVGGEKIDGLINPREGALLYVLARRAAALGNVVEIGSYKGRSTWYLARALEDAGSCHKVVSIDPLMDPATRAAYEATLAEHELGERVEPRFERSEVIAGELSADVPVGMVWIDGDHSYKAVRRDFDDWYPRLATGGWLAMHDTVNSWYGPTRLAREVLAQRSDLVEVGVVFMTLYGRKADPGASNRAAALKARAAFELLTLLQARHAGLGPQCGGPDEEFV